MIPLPAFTVKQVEDAIGPLDTWAHQCHAASLALVRSGLLGDKARVARGACFGVGGQHSWAVIGDCYDVEAPIIDVTAWSYNDKFSRVLITRMKNSMHKPHGYGPPLMEFGCPASGGGDEIVLTPKEPWSREALFWLDMFRSTAGRLDQRFWANLANGTMIGFPAGEFLAAMDDTEATRALVPIDRLGMLTDRNPEGLYR